MNKREAEVPAERLDPLSAYRCETHRLVGCAICPTEQAGAMAIRNEVYSEALGALSDPDLFDDTSKLNDLATAIADGVYKSLTTRRRDSFSGDTAAPSVSEQAETDLQYAKAIAKLVAKDFFGDDTFQPLGGMAGALASINHMVSKLQRPCGVSEQAQRPTVSALVGYEAGIKAERERIREAVGSLVRSPSSYHVPIIDVLKAIDGQPVKE